MHSPLIIRSLVILFLGSIAFSSFAQANAKSNKCIHLFSVSQKNSLYDPTILSAAESKTFNDTAAHEKKSGSTTGDRSELKFTTTEHSIELLTQLFKKNIEAALPGYTLSVRDEVRPGFKNVTWTTYSNRFQIIGPNGKPIIVKIRLRKYGWIAEGAEIHIDNFIVNPTMTDRAWLEFKIENDEVENSVIKPRVLVLDRDAQKLLDPNMTATELGDIWYRMEAINKGATESQTQTLNETIRLMLTSIAEITTHKSKFELQFETIYERASYKIPLKNTKTGERYEVQMTVDLNVSVTETRTGRKASSYSDTPIPVAVIEFKIPTSLQAIIRSGNYDAVPGLKTILDHMKNVEGFSIRKFYNQKGKLGHLRIELY